jgi:predicted O-methyltransferase YrrM
MTDAKPMRPLGRLYQPFERFEISAAGLAEWYQSDTFERICMRYRNYPEQSLQSNEARAFLHHLIVMRRPERALEIGTFAAGTTEVLARALWEAGRGHLDTIDPFGGERCPPIIAALPAPLQERITFAAVSSAAHFDRAMAENLFYDFVLIDGNHEFEYALFDLLCSARLMRPGGLVVLDNIEQPGPRLATRMFLQHHSEWRDVAGVVGRIDARRPFAMPQPSFPDTKFYLLEAPPQYMVGPGPRSFGAVEVDRAEVEGIEVHLAAPAHGTLHIQVFARTFGVAQPEELAGMRIVELEPASIPAGQPVRLTLDKPLRTAFPQAGLPRRVEILLAFSGDQKLALRSPPLPYPARHGRSTGP